MVRVGAVGQPRLERTPDPLNRVVVGAVARPMQHQDAGMVSQPRAHQLAAVDDHVVADHHDLGGGRVGGQELLAEGDEGGADRLAGNLVQEPAAGKVHRPEDAASPVGARGHDPLAGALEDPGRPHPGQQVEVGLVLGQHHRAGGQLADGLAQVGHDLVVVGVALGDQPGPPPAGEDHDQAATDPVWAVQQREHVAGVASRAGAFGVHAGGRILTAASCGRCGRRPARLPLCPVLAHPGLRTEPLATRLGAVEDLLAQL
jgi:hypothetical protein